MVDKPSKFPEWAKEEIINDTSGQLNRVEPPDPVKDEGWRRREIPPRQWWNWLANKVYLWVLWFEDQIENFCVKDDTDLPVFFVRAWATYNGETESLLGGGNVSSVTRNAEGDYTFFFETPMPSSNYALLFDKGETSAAYLHRITEQTTSFVSIRIRNRITQDPVDSQRVNFTVVF